MDSAPSPFSIDPAGDRPQYSREELERRVAQHTNELAERTNELADRTDELRRAEQRFRAIVDASPVPLMLSRVEDGTILYVNNRLEELIGASANSLLGQVTPDFYYDAADRPGILATVRGEGYIRDVELRIKRADGTPRWVSLTVQPFAFDGQPAFATAFLDITERKEAEAVLKRQKAQLEAQSEAAIDGTLVVSENGEILSFNERFVEMWQIPAAVVDFGSDDAAIQSVLDRVEDPAEFAARIAYLYKNPHERARDEIRLLDGRVFDRYSAPVLGCDNEYYGRIWFFRDMTDQKRHSEELEQARHEAESARVEASHYAQSLENDLAFGRRIQHGLLPAVLPQPDGWEIAARFRPVLQVAGDFYDAFELDTGHVGFIIADVAGKGVGAALFMSLFQSLLRASAERASKVATKRTAGAAATDAPVVDPEVAREHAEAILMEAIASTNDYITRVHGHAHMFASVFFGLLCPDSGTIRYVNAGHEPPVIIGPAGPRARLSPTGPALGLMATSRFEVADVTLDDGEQLLAFTDGVTEARDERRMFFTEDRLMSALSAATTTAVDLLDTVETAVDRFSRGADPFDDFTLLAVRRKPSF